MDGATVCDHFFLDQLPDKDGLDIYMSQSRMNSIGISEGNIVKVKNTNGKSIIVKVLSAKNGLSNNFIQVSDCVRKNIGAFLGDIVSLEVIDGLPIAQTVVFSPIADTCEFLDVNLLSQLTNSHYDFSLLPVTKGMVLPIYALNRVIEFKLVVSYPEDSVVINDVGQISIHSKQVKRTTEPRFSDACYRDIGGMDKELKEIRECIEIPLQSPLFFKNIGMTMPKTILITSESGYGKSLIADAIKTETKAYYDYIQCSMLFLRPINDILAIIRNVFNRVVERKPSILFFDDIDQIASVQKINETETESRILHSLLSVFDKTLNSSDVVIIATSKNLSSLDDRFTKGGRFQRIIKLPETTLESRKKILAAAFRKITISQDLLGKIAENSDSMSPFQIVSACNQAMAVQAIHIMNSFNMDHQFEVGDFEKMYRSISRYHKYLPTKPDIKQSPSGKISTLPLSAESSTIVWLDEQSDDEKAAKPEIIIKKPTPSVSPKKGTFEDPFASFSKQLSNTNSPKSATNSGIFSKSLKDINPPPNAIPSKTSQVLSQTTPQTPKPEPENISKTDNVFASPQSKAPQSSGFSSPVNQDKPVNNFDPFGVNTPANPSKTTDPFSSTSQPGKSPNEKQIQPKDPFSSTKKIPYDPFAPRKKPK